MLERSLLSEAMEAAMKKGGDFAEIFVEEKKLSNVLCEDDRIEKVNSGIEKGAGIRVIKDGYTAYVYTNDLSSEGILKAAHVANQAAEGKLTVKQIVPFKVKQTETKLAIKRMPDQVDFAEKIEHVLKANQVVRNLGQEIRQVTVAASDLHKKVQIANSEGDLVEDEICRVRLGVNAIAIRDGQIQTGYETAGGMTGWEILEEVSMEEMARAAGTRAIAMLSAQAAPVGKMPVVMHAEAGGTMVHEACGHGLELDLVQKGLSVYKDKQGQQVAAPQVSVIDDATLKGKYGTFRYDDEGTPAQRTVLIEDGFLRRYMNDRLTAFRDGSELTGNGRRESYQEKPIPRMTNTFIAPGTDDPEEIIRSTKKGLLVKKMGGGQVNTTNGDFVFDVQEGYLIEDGIVGQAVRGAVLTGNGPQVLMNIDRVGHDLGFGIGVCGKDGQGVPVGDAQPTIRIRELTIGGIFQEEQPAIKSIRRK